MPACWFLGRVHPGDDAPDDPKRDPVSALDGAVTRRMNLGELPVTVTHDDRLCVGRIVHTVASDRGASYVVGVVDGAGIAGTVARNEMLRPNGTLRQLSLHQYSYSKGNVTTPEGDVKRHIARVPVAVGLVPKGERPNCDILAAFDETELQNALCRYKLGAPDTPAQIDDADMTTPAAPAESNAPAAAAQAAPAPNDAATGPLSALGVTPEELARLSPLEQMQLFIATAQELDKQKKLAAEGMSARATLEEQRKADLKRHQDEADKLKESLLEIARSHEGEDNAKQMHERLDRVFGNCRDSADKVADLNRVFESYVSAFSAATSQRQHNASQNAAFVQHATKGAPAAPVPMDAASFANPNGAVVNRIMDAIRQQPSHGGSGGPMRSTGVSSSESRFVPYERPTNASAAAAAPRLAYVPPSADSEAGRGAMNKPMEFHRMATAAPGVLQYLDRMHSALNSPATEGLASAQRVSNGGGSAPSAAAPPQEAMLARFNPSMLR